MELKYVVLIIIKILISVPRIFHCVDAAALMGGHLDNKHPITSSNSTNSTESTTKSQLASEEIPDPSPLVLPGYNLPENIFNKGKPFYLERDPLTGKIDFDSKSSPKLDDDMYEDYEDDQPTSDIYDKANIDRKDGGAIGHRPSDVNQLTPNFHDFLNLPIKYNSDKYVYPLISSSYANTKIQGNVNKYQNNHKDYNVKTSTVKPTRSPAYYSSTKNGYFNTPKTSTTSSTTPRTTTVIYLTTSEAPPPNNNLMNSGMNHPSFHEDFEDYYEATTGSPDEVHSTSTKQSVNSIYLTTNQQGGTTKRPMSLFEQLFGDYDETVTTTEKTKPPPLFANLPSNKNNKNKYQGEVKTEKPSFTTPSARPHYPNSHAGPNVLSGSNMGMETSYEYEDESPITDESKEKETSAAPTSTSTTTTTTEATTTTTEITSTPKVTSLPLGENHVSSLNNNQPIIVATQNLREKLNSEKVPPRPFAYPDNRPVQSVPIQQPPSTSHIHIAPDQDTVSFVVGHHQNVEGGNGQYVGTALKETPYDSNPFKPLYGQNPPSNANSVSYTIQGPPEIYPQQLPQPVSAVTIQPMKNSEASLSIGVPVSNAQVPGQVVDAELELGQKIEFPKPNNNKIVFPDDDHSTDNLVPPPNREVLKLNSKPMYHQLPADLTPPREKEVVVPPPRLDRPRPPWDPRPGHFYSGKPEYVRPPRPDIAFKRVDNLPNILPQFRPNMNNMNKPHYHRQPLLERPSNRPIGFFEKLQPPPPPKHLHNLRKIPPPQALEQQQRTPIAEDRIINEAPGKNPLVPPPQDQFNFYQTPPKVVLANRRNSDDISTLQMIQAKKSEFKNNYEETKPEQIVVVPQNSDQRQEIPSPQNSTDKPLYVVYPVNTPPIKMDVIDSDQRESVVIGTRAELPLPPSRINQAFDYEQNPIFNPKDRNDAPVLKPHPRPPNFPIKSDFPYPLERPDPSVLSPVPDTPNNILADEDFHLSNNWNSVGSENLESRIVNGGAKAPNQISVTLRTYTEKPIAVAYTPTEPHEDHIYGEYSMPNYGSPVIPEIRPDGPSAAGKPDSEFTVSAVMHTHPQLDPTRPLGVGSVSSAMEKNDDITPNLHHEQDFQAPFQASVNVDAVNQGWSVVKDEKSSSTSFSRNKISGVSERVVEEATVLPLATTSEFDIENFKPQLEGGFKPIYTYPEDNKDKIEEEVSDRQE